MFYRPVIFSSRMVCVDAMRHDDMAAAADGDLAAVHGQFTEAPMVMFPSQGCLDDVARGSHQRSLPKSRYCNNYRVAVGDKSWAIGQSEEHPRRYLSLKNFLKTLSGRRLVCHCRDQQACLIKEFTSSSLLAYDRNT